MKIKDMFAKKIDREIQGVIIVGQGEDANVSQELEEYVVTRELQKHFADFYSAYKKGIVETTPKMGVWISGFFGSGKSHFLKILSYLLENRQVGDRKAMDYFVEDKKIVDPMVLADMKLAADTPTDVILFNIDSKSETNGKQNKDAIVNVFLKVFNQMQGLLRFHPHVADLERRLSEEGRYDEFKATFEEEYGDPWEDSRQDFDFIQDSVVDALVSMDFMSEAAARELVRKRRWSLIPSASRTSPSASRAISSARGTTTMLYFWWMKSGSTSAMIQVDAQSPNRYRGTW